MEVCSQLHAPVALPPGKELPVTNWIGGCMGPRAGLEAVAKGRIPASAGYGIPVVQPVA